MAQDSAENLNKLGLLKRKGGLSTTERAVNKDARAAFAKRNSNLSRSPDRDVGESQGGREPHLDKRGDQSGSMGRKEWILK